MKTAKEYQEECWYRFFAKDVEPPFLNDSSTGENKKKIKNNDESEQSTLF